MNKALFGLCLLSAAVSFGGVNNKVIAFSTQGEDKYADGTRVLDGEYYALVWTKNGATFEGIDTSGKIVGDAKENAILLKAPVAKDGRCPFIQFEIDEACYADRGLGGGTLAVYLLDTRKFKSDADGVLVTKDGKFEVESWGREENPVNGYGNTGATIDVSAGVTSADVSSAVAAADSSAVTEGGNARFAKIEQKGDYVYLHVDSTASTVRYQFTAGGAPDALDKDLGQRYGTSGREMIIVREAKAGGEFFKMSVGK